MRPLVSIIIPTYNRFHLIGKTLDSIISQTYKSWECIVVDDGSTDYTDELLEFYCERDSRIQYHFRPPHKLKGANACRNYGFKLSKGKYIQWFDSDDLMVEKFLKDKLEAIHSGNYDFVISKTEDFEDPNPSVILGINQYCYRFDEHNLTHSNYVLQRINWLTPDFMVKKTIVNCISFNEKLPSGQEYNFLCKLTAKTTRAVIVNKVLTYRRIHENSVRGELIKNENTYFRNRGIIDYENWQDLKNISTPQVLDYLFRKSVRNSLKIEVEYKFKYIIVLGKEIKDRYSSYTFFLYLSYQILGRSFRKGHFLRKKFLQEWN